MRHMKIIGLAIAALAVVALLAASAGRPQPRLVVLIIIDTLRADHLGCYGHDAIETPHLDQLAREGTLYAQAITAAPVTLPSVTSIMTGAYPVQHGIRDNGAYQLGDAWCTVGERFAEAGYRTGAFVSAGVLGREHRLDQGFEVYDDDFGAPFTIYDPVIDALDVARQGIERRANDTVDQALAWALDHRGEDLFLCLHLFDPHLPRDPPPAFRRAYAHNLYDGEIAFTDSEIGRLLAGLRVAWSPREMLTVVVGDHGEGLGDHEEELHGFLLFDELVRVPLILHGRGIRSGQRVAEVVRTIDIAPTICAIAGLTTPDDCVGHLLPGVSPAGGNELAYMPAGGSFGRVAYLETLRPRLSHNWCEQRGLRTERWKLVTGPDPELYDLVADPGERHNLAVRLPQVRDSLCSLMDAVGLAARSRDAHAAGRVAMSPEQEERLRSLGYVTRSGSAPAANTESAVAEEDSVALWGFSREARGVTLGLPSPRETLPAYNRRLAARSHLRVGMAALSRDDLDAAEAALHKAASIDPQFADPHLRFAEVCSRRGDAAGALRVLEAALAAGLASPEIYERLAALRRGAREFSAVEAAMQEASRRVTSPVQRVSAR